MKVQALLREKGSAVVTIRPEQTVREAAAELSARRIGALVVSGGGGAIDGIISERDVVARIGLSGAEVLEWPVRAIMAGEVRTCAASDEVADLMAVMTDHRIRHLPVLGPSGLCGMISIGDVVKARVDELVTDRERLHDYINAR